MYQTESLPLRQFPYLTPVRFAHGSDEAHRPRDALLPPSTVAVPLRSGLVNLTGMAFEMARDARKSPSSGVVPPVEGFDAAGRSQLDRPSDLADLHGLLCRKPLKGSSLPAGLLLASAQIRSDHSSQINES